MLVMKDFDNNLKQIIHFSKESSEKYVRDPLDRGSQCYGHTNQILLSFKLCRPS